MSHFTRSLLFTCILMSLFTFSAFRYISPSSLPAVTLSGDVLPEMKHTTLMKTLPATISIELYLQVQNRAGLNTLLANLYDEHSPQYHQYLNKGAEPTLQGILIQRYLGAS
jgi:subtilase family serine protease